MKQLITDKLAGRTQRWLCKQVGMTDVDLSNSIHGFRKFRENEFALIRRVLKIKHGELAAYGLSEYEFHTEKEKQ